MGIVLLAIIIIILCFGLIFLSRKIKEFKINERAIKDKKLVIESEIKRLETLIEQKKPANNIQIISEIYTLERKIKELKKILCDNQQILQYIEDIKSRDKPHTVEWYRSPEWWRYK